MNRPIRAVSLVAMLMFLALMLNVSVSYLFRTGSLLENNQNRRMLDARYGQNRGDILVGNTVIAESVAVKDQYNYLRKYAQGKLYAPITGFYSYNYGSSGLESSYGSQLSGSDDSLLLQQVWDALTGAGRTGASIETTIDADAQQAAAAGLGDKKGAVVALNPDTGAILAMVTSPSYDPNQLASHDISATKNAWTELNSDPDKPMQNRSAQEIFPPGSTFKVITAAAALEAGATSSTMYASPDSLTLPGTNTQLINYGGESCGAPSITLKQALGISCNTAFANVGLTVGEDALRAMAKKFGFETRPITEIPSVASNFPDDLSRAQVAQSAIGQFDVAATPLQMAMVAAAVANEGVLMKPYLVQTVRGSDLNVISRTTPTVFSNVMSKTTAFYLQDMMEYVVTDGTGKAVAISGVTIGAKTGTAENVEGKDPYAWMIAYSNNPKVAVAVFVQEAAGGITTGGVNAAPIARRVIQALR